MMAVGWMAFMGSWLMNVIAYYSTLMVLVLFNAYFTKSKKNVTRRNMAGNH